MAMTWSSLDELFLLKPERFLHFLSRPCLYAGIKKYVVGLIIKTSSDAASVEVRVVSRFTLEQSFNVI